MNPGRGQTAELDELLGALREGWIRPEQRARLEELLAADPDARDYYIHYMELCSTLHYYQGMMVRDRPRPGSDVVPPAVAADASPAASGFRQRLPWRWPWSPSARMGRLVVATMIAAALLVAGIGLLLWTGRPRGPLPRNQGFARVDRQDELALVVELDAVRWPSPDGPRIEEGATLTSGVFRIQGGCATLAFLNGVWLAIEGPGEIELVSLNRVYCHRGKLRVRVPPEAEGFVVGAPGSAFVDQGTDFAINVEEDGRATVKVIQGATEAALLGASGNPDRTWLVKQDETFELNPATRQIIKTTGDSGSFASLPAWDLPPLVLDPSYPDVVAASEPRGYWRFEAREGDLIRNQIPGGVPIRAIGPIGLAGTDGGNGCAEFQAGHPDQYLAADGLWAPAIEPGHAVELWFLPTTIGYASLVALHPPTGPGRYKHVLLVELTGGGRQALFHKPASVRFLHRWPPDDIGGQNVYSNDYYLPYRWYHLVVQKNGGRMELYMDGELSDTVLLEAVHATTPCRLVVGRMGLSFAPNAIENRAFVGRIDELAVYDRPLSGEEIRRHHRLGARRIHPRGTREVGGPLGSTAVAPDWSSSPGSDPAPVAQWINRTSL